MGHLRAADNLRRQNDLVAPLAGREPGPDDLFRAAFGACFWGNWIKLSRVEEINALINSVIHLRMAFGFAILFAPGHGAETNGADIDARAAKFTHFHEDALVLEE
ncbi:hypothetical protein MnTg02_02015 [bacterium MnTg02]|nr:hypothetical protein MnTg02_02015 [bacterium MnTg02]